MKSEKCGKCEKRKRKSGYRYCSKCLWHLMPEIQAWSERESHYEPPAIHEGWGRYDRVGSPDDLLLAGRHDDAELISLLLDEED